MKKDSALSRQGIPDYLVTMRKPGVNPDPITKDPEKFPVDLWQRYASPVWFDINQSNTLQKESAREQKDEKHICPLQLDVIERAVELWTNPGDLVLSPFTGIGSEGFVSVAVGRRFVGAELKQSYRQAGRRGTWSAPSARRRSRRCSTCRNGYRLMFTIGHPRAHSAHWRRGPSIATPASSATLKTRADNDGGYRYIQGRLSVPTPARWYGER